MIPAKKKLIEKYPMVNMTVRALRIIIDLLWKIVRGSPVTVLKAFYGMETELSRRKEDWEELNKIDLEQFYKLRLSERFNTYAQIKCVRWNLWSNMMI